MQPQANLSVDEVLAFSDVELVEYMKNNRRPDGAFKLGNIDGWERLPSDQRHQLAERLRFGAQKASPAITSRPVDLDEVAARLLEISAERDKSTRSPQSPSRRERSPTEVVDLDALEKTLETEAYNKLVGDGGRPVYPIDLLDHVSQHPEAYRELLRPWQGGWPDLDPPRWEMVFQRQWESWKHFREWQVDNRELFNEEAEFSAFVEEAKKQRAEAKNWWPEETRKVLERRTHELLKAEYQKLSSKTAVADDDEGFLAFVEEKRLERLKQGIESAAKTEDEYLQVLRTQFNEKRARRRWLYFYPLREDRGQGGFAGYVDEAQRRLARHGFPRTFHFDEDPKRQDSLTTWIEYVNYECAWYDEHVRAVERLRPRHEEAWKALVDSGVLRPGETEEYLLTDESALQRQTERDQAEMAVKSAEEFGEAALRETAKAKMDPRRSRYTKEERTRRLAAAHSRLMAAKASLRATTKRTDLIADFIRESQFYREKKRHVLSHSLLLQWLRDQMPLVEAELVGSKEASNSSVADRDAEVGRERESEVASARKTAKRKRLNQPNMLPGDPSLPAREEESSKRVRHDDAMHDTPPSKRVRKNTEGLTVRGASSVGEPLGPEDIPVAIQDKPWRAGRKASVSGKGRVPASQGISQPEGFPQQLRRSARIAARNDAAKLATAAQPVKNTGSRPSRRVVQPPTPPSSATSRAPAAKKSKPRAAASGDRLGKSKPERTSRRRKPR
ncbi:uncharacterized protein THITE_2107924 [Thermothielavioides terrestris NRRL 8126]|uniref:Uncharacterized protein n=1 Tax=Thermothielavioides terrestris (strain ATCC 38088 / NRRL 8126) TaxID=578455 RepID=G2QW96_THETT|nr:uncharacterized protein THITE_2107924 [Thermothielavioides terrestris NRRL 8126]AEO63071.1 hypothetical protein THITE_2107924 [Thermothielavioides terrestris NRRL 8126]